jgi:thioredoxin 1
METTQKESFVDIIKSEKPVLIDFSAVWCGPCKMMEPVLKELRQRMGDTVRIIKIDIDRNQQLSSALEVQSVPTLMLFQKGNLLWRESGVMQAAQLEKVIKQFSTIE